MRRIALAFFVSVFLTSFLYAIKLDKEGKAWLERNTQPAEVNVTGVWNNEEWGFVTLEQPQGSREIRGDGDLWKIDGVVSGKKAFLLFSKTGVVEFSAVLDFTAEDTLKGNYSRDLITTDKPGKKAMLLKRKSSKVVQQALGAENETARVIIYMKIHPGKPGIFLDGRQLVWMDSWGYFSFRLAPGPHEIYIRGSGWLGGWPYNDPVKIDARAGDIHCFEAGAWGTWVQSWELKAKSKEICMKDIKKMKPLKAKFVLVDSIVSLNPIAAK